MRYTSISVDDVTFSHNGPMAHHVYFLAAIEDDEHNSRYSNQILLINKDWKNSL